MKPRMLCNFSCGAASAVATKLAIAQFQWTHEIRVRNAFIKEEHPDNRRFLRDCEQWFGYPVEVLRETKHDASAREVFRRHRYLVGLQGAKCTKVLKREILNADWRPDDTIVLGFTVEEQSRLDDWIDANNEKRCIAPLVEQRLGKLDALAIIERAGLALPLMYRLGFHNANCIGCVKGGMGYWNKVREHFPDDFEEMAQIQEAIGAGAYLFRDRRTGVRFSLRSLRPDQGRYPEEPSIECGAACELGESSIEAGELA